MPTPRPMLTGFDQPRSTHSVNTFEYWIFSEAHQCVVMLDCGASAPDEGG